MISEMETNNTLIPSGDQGDLRTDAVERMTTPQPPMHERWAKRYERIPNYAKALDEGALRDLHTLEEIYRHPRSSLFKGS